jgi:hypothetical protein
MAKSRAPKTVEFNMPLKTPKGGGKMPVYSRVGHYEPKKPKKAKKANDSSTPVSTTPTPKALEGGKPLRQLEGGKPVRAITSGGPRQLEGPKPRQLEGPKPRQLEGPKPRQLEGPKPRQLEGPKPRAIGGGRPARALPGPQPKGIEDKSKPTAKPRVRSTTARTTTPKAKAPKPTTAKATTTKPTTPKSTTKTTTPKATSRPTTPKAPVAEPGTPHAILGVSPNASSAQLKLAWRRLVRENHPDINPDKKDGERFKEISKAASDLGII